MAQLDDILSPERALIFRITHRSNVPWLLRNGLHCASSSFFDPDFVSIGNSEIIDRRRLRPVPKPPSPGGTLNSYIPFYFTPCSLMLYNILTGYRGIRQRDRDEIVFLVSSFDQLDKNDVQYVFSDRHALLTTARFFRTRRDLRHVDFDLLRRRDFRRDNEDLGKLERYQAEALVHEHLPVRALVGLACFNQQVQRELRAACSDLDLRLSIAIRQPWYFHP